MLKMKLFINKSGDIIITKNDNEMLDRWTPRISSGVGILLCIVPSIVSWIFVILVVYRVKKQQRDEQQQHNRNRSKSSTSSVVNLKDNSTGFLSKLRTRLCTSRMLLIFYGRLIWDALDVTLDSVLFYRLEFESKMLHENIFRNDYVNNAILVFAIFGCIKIILWVPFSRLNLHISQYYMFLLTFYMEDGPELILEYFYIEKYMKKHLLWMLIVKDCVITFLALYTIYDAIQYFLAHQGDFKYGVPILLTKFLIGLLECLRIGGALYQYVTGMLHRSCFAVYNNDDKNQHRITQTPFSKGCVRGVDNAIMFFSVLLVLSFLIGCFSILISRFRRMEKREDFVLKEHANILR